MVGATTHARLAVTTFLLALPLAHGSAGPTGAGTYLAVAEDGFAGEAGRTAIHVAFHRSGKDWIAVSQPPADLNWSVCFDGRAIGTAHSALRKEKSPIQLLNEIHEVGHGEKLPFVGKRSKEFTGWMLDDVFHPLVLNSAKHCSDPEHWRPAAPPASMVAKLAPAFRRATKGIHDCGSNGNEVPFVFQDSDIKAGKSYVSDSGARIVSLFVRAPPFEKSGCDGPFYGPHWQPHTFGVLPDGSVKHLGFDLRVIDAGDYDGDGRSEVVFQSRDYNRDGYVLSYDSFRRYAGFDWGYH